MPALRRGTKRRVPIVLALVGTVGIGACGRSDVLYEDDQYGAHGGRGGVGSAGRATGGAVTGGGPGAGGAITGGGPGAGGAVTGGSFGVGGTGGSIIGVGGGVTTTGGSGGVAGAAAGGTSGASPDGCERIQPTCDTFTNFSTQNGTTWGIGDFEGGIALYGNGIVRTAEQDGIHVQGIVSDDSNRIVIYFTSCADLSKYAGIYFTLSGTTDGNGDIYVRALTHADVPSSMSSDLPVLGACGPSQMCDPPATSSKVYPVREYTYWSDFYSGNPVTWNAATGPLEIDGIEWAFRFDPSIGSYGVDVTLDDVGFIRNGIAAPDCGAVIGGTGGSAGMGAGGFSGGFSAGGFSAGGFAGDFSAGGFSSGGFSGDSAGGFSAGGFAGDFSVGGFSSGGFAGDFSSGGFSAGGFAGDFSAGGFSAGGFAGDFSSGGFLVGGFSGTDSSGGFAGVSGSPAGGLAGSGG